MGYKFLFQHPVFYKWDDKIKFFIADFYYHPLKLIIEIDGEIHKQQKNYDQARSELLASKMINIIRFSNNEILNDINSVLIKLKKQITSTEKSPPVASGGLLGVRKEN